MHSRLFLVSPFVLLFTPAASWGNLGHRTVGYLATKYMTPQAIDYFNGIVNPSDSFDISDAAVWADSHKMGDFAYTYNWHFIDARDDPPHTCNVNFNRDCDPRDECDSHKEPGCVVGAIANMTSQLISTLDANLQDQMKFLLHFVGDVHQPLHAENLDVGGNTICIKWHGNRHNEENFFHSHRSDDHSDRINSDDSDPDCPRMKKCVNLHQAWDTLMIEKLLNYEEPHDHDERTAAEKAAAQQWAVDLFSDTVGNPDLVAGDCLPTSGNADDATDCALAWASESNNLICSFVLKDGVEGVEDRELSGAYYKGAVPIIKFQISRAARRFAAILNAIATASGVQKDLYDGQVVMEEL